MMDLPERSGSPPKIMGPAPHGQISQIAPIMQQEQLWERMRALPFVYMAPTLVSVSHARSVFLPEGIGSGAGSAFQAGREFAHIHPHQDGSLHLTLPERYKDSIEASAWGVRHPQQNSILVYGPRDAAELEIVWGLVKLSYRYALGELE
jgi:Family of unknown function (DUF5519)